MELGLMRLNFAPCLFQINEHEIASYHLQIFVKIGSYDFL